MSVLKDSDLKKICNLDSTAKKDKKTLIQKVPNQIKKKEHKIKVTWLT